MKADISGIKNVTCFFALAVKLKHICLESQSPISANCTWMLFSTKKKQQQKTKWHSFISSIFYFWLYDGNCVGTFSTVNKNVVVPEFPTREIGYAQLYMMVNNHA